MKKLVLLFMFLATWRCLGASATNVQHLSQFGTTNRAVGGDGVGLSTRYATAQERLLGIRVTNLVTSLNALGIGTNTVIIAAGTNITVVTNRTSSNVTYTISFTNAVGSSGDSVWTNNGGIIYPLAVSGQATNSIQISTNGGLLIGSESLPYWGTPLVAGETLVSMRSSTNDTLNELFLGFQSTGVVGYFDALQDIDSSGITIAYGLPGIVLETTPTTNFLFRASNGAGQEAWAWHPNLANNVAYKFNTFLTWAPDVHLMEVANNFTNKFEIYGDGNVNVVGQITNQFLTANQLVGTDENKGLVSTLSVTNATTNWFFSGNNSNTVARLGDVTNIVNSLTNTFASTSYIFSVIGNYMNLSVQAAKLPTTNYPAIDAGWQNWELVYHKTNAEGVATALSATWQFVTPTNYFTNNMKVYGQSILLSTNGASTSNVIWRASVFRATPGDSTDVHVGSFGATVTATQSWAASNTGTNKVQDFLIDLSTNSLIQMNDFGILKLERVGSNDTVMGSVSLIGLQLRY